MKTAFSIAILCAAKLSAKKIESSVNEPDTPILPDPAILTLDNFYILDGGSNCFSPSPERCKNRSFYIVSDICGEIFSGPVNDLDYD